MEYGTILKSCKLNGITTIKLDKIYPIKPLDESSYQVQYLINGQEQELFLGSFYADEIVVSSKKKDDVELRLGHGYLTEQAPEWTNRFITDDPWQGGDGIFTFNMDNGRDGFDQEKQAKTLFVFGDTFVGRYHPETLKRLDPHLMPNNSLAYLDDDKLEFKLNRGPYGNIKAFYDVPEEYDYSGYIPQNLVSYDTQKPLFGYLSEYHPDSIELNFDLHVERHITHVEFFNYFDPAYLDLAKRGMKNIILYGSNDQKQWNKITSVSLSMATNPGYKERVNIFGSHRYIKLVCDTENSVGNHNDSQYQEGLFGLNQVRFYNDTVLYRDIWATSNTILTMSREHSWIWLQDGVVIGEHLYFLPLIIGPDPTQVEGMQFKVIGLQMFKTPIVNGELVTEQSTHKLAPVFAYDKESSYFYGAGMMANTKQADAVNPDGYVYVYGYKTTVFLRELIVSRVKAEKFEYFDDWEYWNGASWSKNILDSAPLLGHVSCELSVSPILEGQYKGKYLAVFTYDVNTEYVSFAIGDSPVGPFTKPQKIYKTPEQDIFKSTTYTYNAKAHPHLSRSKKVLVTYNTNTYNFEHNMSNRLVYKARFIYLNEI